MACLAVADGSDFAMQLSRIPEAEAIQLYDKAGNKREAWEFESGQEMAEVLNDVTDDIEAYNGQSVYFEGDYDFELGSFEVIP